jgi:outer membrane protein assembly factor BamB
LKEHPRLAGDAELKSQLDALRANEHTWVRYTPIGQPLSAAAGREGEMPYLVITPMTQGQPGKSQDSDAVVLGMARGILYALGQSNGELRWAMRLGLDTQVFPIRLPASPPQPEIGLIYAAETNTLLGVDVQVGRLLWQHPLGAACTASPVLVGRRAFVATQDGVVHEIEVVDGRLLGRYEIGQPLTVAGAFDAATRRLYQPADHKRVYVLDVEANVCAGVLYTNHSAGSLRGPPIASESTLVLAESTSLGTMRVRSLTVAANVAETKIEPRADAYDVPGWSWFPPYFDGDTVAYVTDRGYLALFGVRRKTRDRPLFPLAPPLRVAGGPEGDMATGRAQVALQDLDQWWLLARGRLVKDRFDLYRQDLHRTGDEAHPLGMPLHESQLPTWNRPLVLVTQEPDQPRVFATAFSGPHNLIRWQRQLGMIGIRDPILVDGHCVAVDASGGVFHLPAAQAPLAGNEAWRTGGEWKASAWRPSQPPRFVKSADGHSAVVILYDQAAEMLVIRHFEPAKGLLERQFRFDVAPVGTPAALGNVLVVPCRDGNLYEFSLQGGSDAPLPLTWRDRNAGNQAAGHAVFLSPEQLLVTDGLRRLQQWQRGPAEKAWRKASERTLELPARIVSPPLVLAAAGSERQICVAQDGGTVHLISGSRLVTVQQWRLGAAITAGPFALGQRIGCVLENRRLVCLDPASPKPLWEHQVEGLGVQGEPQYADDAVLITDISGAFTWLDAKTGSVRDQQKLPFRAVPTAAAVPMAPGRALAPLSDGTLLLLGTRRSPQTRAD